MSFINFYYLALSFYSCPSQAPNPFSDNCYSICPPYYYPNVTNNSTTCVSCYNPGYHPYLTCYTFCNSTMLNCAYSFNTSVCLNCFIGNPVFGGCSSTIGCALVTQINQYTTNHTSVCSLCRTPEFYPTLQNGKCVCSRGFLAGVACTEIFGCTSAINNGSNSECFMCNSLLGLILQGQTCTCIDGYILINICVQICGDGKLFQLGCDDGNNENGDGCSSTCKV